MDDRNPEIGSHFSYDMNSRITSKHGEKPFWEVDDKDYTYTFSGRTALNIAIQDINASNKIERAYLPSYCCTSMIEPFTENQIQIEFYDVYYDEIDGLKYNIDLNKKCDVFLAMSYFGINSKVIDPYIEAFSKRGIPVIEDITHRLFSSPYCSKKSDFIVASIRKWLPLYSGGFIRKEHGVLLDYRLDRSDALVVMKSEAMHEKHKYLKGDLTIEKEKFYQKFIDFENNLSEVGFSFDIDVKSHDLLYSIDLETIRKARNENSAILYRGVASLKTISPIIKDYNDNEDCPLFVPVNVSNDRRDDLRKFLIARQIYCPVHWPNDDNRPRGLEDSSLSLICDQRYGKREMDIIVETMNEWEKLHLNN